MFFASILTEKAKAVGELEAQIKKLNEENEAKVEEKLAEQVEKVCGL